MKRIKLMLAVFIGILLTLGATNFYWVYVANRFEVISEGKVYKSGVMPDKKLKKIIEKYKIKTIVDLRKPKDIKSIEQERSISGTLGVIHVNIPSDQVPKDETMQKFLRIMDDKKSYPVLIHCEHGEGRAVLFSAIYRIEYENWDNNKARCASRIITYGTSFSLNASKGKYLNHYTPRKKVIQREARGRGREDGAYLLI
jgi:protein tyrosine/serine phosphatase